MSPDGTLYAIGSDTLIYKVSTISGSTTLITPNSPCWVSLAFGSDGFLYCTSGYGQEPDQLWRIDPISGESHLVGDTGYKIIGLASGILSDKICDKNNKHCYQRFDETMA